VVRLAEGTAVEVDEPQLGRLAHTDNVVDFISWKAAALFAAERVGL
jgi:hypothetical protein